MNANHSNWDLIRDRKAFLESGFNLATTQCSEEPLTFGLDVLCSNAFAIANQIMIKGNQSNSADGIFNMDLFLCMEVCINAITKLIDANPQLMEKECYEAWGKLKISFQRIVLGQVIGRSLVNSLLLLACAAYLIDRRQGKPYLPESNFPEGYITWLSSCSPPILLKQDSANQDLMNCMYHLDAKLGNITC